LVLEEKHDFANLTFSDFFMKFLEKKLAKYFFGQKMKIKRKK
jgi:hypothetical protein